MNIQEHILILFFFNNMTPLSLACRSENIEMVNFLLSLKGIEIRNMCFIGSSFFTELTIPPHITSIGDNSFMRSFATLNVWSGNAFEDCKSLKQITINGPITEIGWHVFYGCVSLEEVKIPQTVETIGICAFFNCSSLKKVEIPNSVTLIDTITFAHCAFEKLNLPSSLIKIGERAFEGCRSLIQISIPKSVNSIGPDAFSSCKKLSQISIPASIDRQNLGLNSDSKIDLI